MKNQSLISLSRKLSFALLTLSLCALTHKSAASPDSPPPTSGEQVAHEIEENIQKVNEQLNKTRQRREEQNYFVYGMYSPIDLLIPSKIGASVGSIRSADKTWELEYLRGSLSVPFIIKDLGSMTDERISLTARSYFGGNSFNVSYGFAYSMFSLHLGDDLLNRASGGSYPSMDLVKIESLGLHFGLGNRWVFQKNISLGVDWFAWSQPIVTTQRKSVFLDHATNQNDYKNVDDAIRFVSYMPRWTLLKIQVGILF